MSEAMSFAAIAEMMREMRDVNWCQGQIIVKHRQLILDCQRDLAEYLVPDSGITREQVIARLLERLDGPQAREALR